ncbi:MAG: YjbF family lipoprotein [Pseudorhodobacter sp.]
MMRKNWVWPFLVALALAGCGSDKEETEIFDLARSALPGGKANEDSQPAAKDLGLTRAFLATLSKPVDLITMENSGAQAVIAKIETNDGVETWSSVNNRTFALRQKIVTATRGLGVDLISSAVPSQRQVSTDGGSHRRMHVVLGDNDRVTRTYYDCQVRALGDEALSFVERSYRTRRFQEVCNGPDGGFRNDYWFQIGGTLRQSRQFIAPGAGYVSIRHLTD